jgi:hypothetical protein
MFKYRFKILIGIYLAALLLGMITGCTKEKCVVCPPDQPQAEKEYYFLYSYGVLVNSCVNRFFKQRAFRL